MEGKRRARYLVVPRHDSPEAREEFLAELDRRAKEPEQFVAGVTIDFRGSSHDGIVKFDTTTGHLRLNGWHPFVSTFHDEFINRKSGRPLELVAMAEVLAEAHLHSIGVKVSSIEEFLTARDQLLRHLANESGRQSALSIANSLSDARNSPDRLEEGVCSAFRSLGFDVTRLGKSGQPDGVGTAYLSADDSGTPRQYKVSLEAKSKEDAEARVSAKDVGIATVVRHLGKFECDHAVVVGPAFATSKGGSSALGESIDAHRRQAKTVGRDSTITLITVDALAQLVRLRPLKRVGLQRIRELFNECSLPEQSAAWVESIRSTSVEMPPYRKIVETIETLQRRFRRASVNYAALRVELTHVHPPIDCETDEELAELCKAMAQMAPGAIFADSTKVELDQSAENVIAAIEAATQDYPLDEQ